MNHVHAIEISDLNKSFRKMKLSRGYTTFKSLLLHPFTGHQEKTTVDVLKGVNITVGHGQTLGLIGRNGSGKSTLLKIMAGIYSADTGMVNISGRISSLIELGTGFHPEFTGRENIFMNGMILGLNKREIKDRMDEIIAFAELEEYIDAPVRTYSSGMYVRLGFSIATNVEPDIILIDEVLAVGDEAFAEKCKARIKKFKQAGKTIIIVSHDMDAINDFCDRTIWLDDGVIAADGKPDKIIDAYRKSYVKRQNATFINEENRYLNGSDRWGDKSVEVTGVTLLDSSMKPQKVNEPDQGLIISMNYKMNNSIKDVVFGIGISDEDGVKVYRTNTNIDKKQSIGLPREGTVRFKADKLDLVDGVYTIDVVCHDENGRAYDFWTKCTSFAVRTNNGDSGLYRIPHTWEFE